MKSVEDTIRRESKKIKPVCPVFGECGGCAYQDTAYPLELKLKEAQIKEKITEALEVEENVFKAIVASDNPFYYRHRIDLKLQRTRDGILIGYTPRRGRGILPVEKCPIALESINREIPVIKSEAVEKLPDKYRQANITIRGGDDGRVFWGGIGRRSLKMKEDDFLWTEINGRRIYFAMETFFQANLSILPKLMETIRAFKAVNPENRLFDLYGGVGLFSVNLYDRFQHVTLIEEVEASIACAEHNKAYHTIENMDILQGRVEDHLKKLVSGAGDNRVAIIDPPRAGLSASVCSLLKETKLGHLIYLSCNPEALIRDLKCLIEKDWRIKSITPFDFFPRTKHIETLVELENAHGGR